jgi:hypothetical protein
MVAILHQGIERSGGTRLVEYSSESIATSQVPRHLQSRGVDLNYLATAGPAKSTEEAGAVGARHGGRRAPRRVRRRFARRAIPLVYCWIGAHPIVLDAHIGFGSQPVVGSRKGSRCACRSA